MIIFQFNEANFDIIEKYVQNNNFTFFSELLNNYKCLKTKSENIYENIEPWIQWVSFYTGKSYNEHEVFHLGEYEIKEENDLFLNISKMDKSLGIFGSMNHPGIKNSIFIPDPWSVKKSDGSFENKAMQNVLNFFVNRNTQLPFSFSIIPNLFIILF